MKSALVAATLVATATATSVALLLAGCSTPIAAPSSAPSSAGTSGGLSGSIVVDAASSLTGSFTAIAAAFEALHPGTTVTMNYGGSGALAAALVAGAPADVFAAASARTMTTVSTANLVLGTPAVFARNELEIVVPAGNPGAITGLADFANTSKKTALCDPAQPCGAAAVAVFVAAKITAAPVTLEPDVKSALTAVELDQVDAAMVYHTDVLAGGTKVEGITFPSAAQFVLSYPIAPLTTSKDPALAAAFVAYVLSDSAQKILKHAGFLAT